MDQQPNPAVQLELFISQSPAYQAAVDRYEAIRPILKENYTLAQQGQATGVSPGRLRRYLQRFQQSGLQGLIDQRKQPH